MFAQGPIKIKDGPGRRTGCQKVCSLGHSQKNVKNSASLLLTAPATVRLIGEYFGQNRWGAIPTCGELVGNFLVFAAK